MTCGSVRADAKTVAPGILAIPVYVEADRETKDIHVAECAAALCIEREDSLCWDNTIALWSNRARTVRDVELKRVNLKAS